MYDLRNACLTCSFQAEDMVVLHQLRQQRADIPVLFLDTGYHFPETIAYRDRMTAEWSLNLVNLRNPKPLDHLYATDPTACCHARKVEPLAAGLEPFEIWFTGLRREQSLSRRNLEIEEDHRLPSGKLLKKVSPLALWTSKEVFSYAAVNEIPLLPLYEQGYPSIGCAPCTQKPSNPDDPRSGRWAGQKLECGIHTFTK